MRLAIAVWNNRVSPVFDVSRQIALYENDGGTFRIVETGYLESDSRRERLKALEAMGADILICGAVTGCMARELAERDIEVIPFVTGDTETVLNAYLRGEIGNPEFQMPGCGGHRRRRGQCSGRGRGMGRGSAFGRQNN